MNHDNGDPAAYLRVMWSDEERADAARIEKAKTIYVESQRDDDLLRLLKRVTFNAAMRRDARLPHAADNRAPGKGLVIVAPSGAGKTTLLRETFRNHAAFPNYGSADAWCPLISVAAPAPCTLLQLAIRILEYLGYPVEREIRENRAWHRVRQQLRAHGILFLHIDDLNNALHEMNEKEVQKVRDVLRDLMDSPGWPVQVIASGTPELLPFARHDRQLRRRLRFMALTKLRPSEHAGFLDDAIREYAATAELKLAIDPEDEIVPRLMHAGQYEMGLCLEILGEAVQVAFDRDRKTLKRSDFADAYADRNLMPDDQNIFIANAWHAVDASRLQPKDADEQVEASTAPRRHYRRKKA